MFQISIINGVKKKEEIQVGMNKKNKIAKDLRTAKYRPRVIKNKKKAEELKRLKRFYIMEYMRQFRMVLKCKVVYNNSKVKGSLEWF